MNSRNVQGLVKIDKIKYTDKDGNEREEEEIEVIPSKSGAVAGAVAGTALATAVGVAAAPVALAAGFVGLIFGPAD